LGYDLAFSFASVGTELLLALGTAGLSRVSLAGRIGDGVRWLGTGLNVLDGGRNFVGMVVAVGDMLDGGVDSDNILRLTAGLLGFTANLTTSRWWTKGAQKDAEFRALTPWAQDMAEPGAKTVPTSVYRKLLAAYPPGILGDVMKGIRLTEEYLNRKLPIPRSLWAFFRTAWSGPTSKLRIQGDRFLPWFVTGVATLGAGSAVVSSILR
jgi:hypothetical protein